MNKFLLALSATLLVNSAWALDTLKGEVLEAKDVEIYTYLLLKTKDGEVWAAVNKAPIKKGAQVTIENAMEMRNFESKGLKKTFDRIIFGTLAGDAPAASAPHGKRASVPVDAASVTVPKAQGPDARTVAEIYAKSAALKDKPVLLRATVVKVTLAVMGKNWIHLRDGTGTDNDNDIIATTTEKVEPGAVVVVKGVVRTDVDLGSGYAYKVLIENATLQK